MRCIFVVVDIFFVVGIGVFMCVHVLHLVFATGTNPLTDVSILILTLSIATPTTLHLCIRFIAMYIYMVLLTHSDARTHSTFGSGTGADDEQSRRRTRVFSFQT